MAGIPDDIKIFLRSVLVTTPGMQQSHVAKEYFETTDERIEYVKYGYKNMYEFLVALQGEVTRLEFSPKHHDNLVFAVLDATKYASRHAQKYAGKTTTGMPPKSPEEIIAWKKQHLSSGTLPLQPKKNNRGGGKGGGGKNKGKSRGGAGSWAAPRRGFNISKPAPSRPILSARPSSLVQSRATAGETSASVDEWSLLRRLIPERSNKFTLLLKVGDGSQSVKFNRSELFSHFAAYNIIKDVTYRYEYAHKGSASRQEFACIAFPTHFTAFRAWKEKDNSILLGRRIGVEPAGGSLRVLMTPLFKVMVLGLPQGVIMSTFVTKFVRFSNLVCIDARPREGCAFITYTNEESAHRACTEVVKIKVDGEMVTLNVQPLEGDEPPPPPVEPTPSVSETPPASSSDRKLLSPSSPEKKLTKLSYNTNKEPQQRHLPRQQLQQPQTKSKQICNDYKHGRCTRAVCKFLHVDATDEIPGKLSVSLDEKPVVASVVKAEKEEKTKDNSDIDDAISLEGRVCDFCISYQQWFQMFQMTRRKQPVTLANYPDEIQLLVTFQTQPIRFWGWVVGKDVEKHAQKLGFIEENLAEMVKKVQPPTNLPAAGHRGVALYKDETTEAWYRCYVMAVDSTKDQIEVFFCDYGYSAWISRELFRSTYNDTWSLDPLAVPFKLHSVEMEGEAEGKFEKLNISEMLHARVVKSSVYSEPHIVELSNITYTSSGVCVDKQIKTAGGVVSTDMLQEQEEEGKEELSQDEEDEEEEEEDEDERLHTMTSLFDYNYDDLVNGVLCGAHHPNLLYLNLGDVFTLHEALKLALNGLNPTTPATRFEKETIMMLRSDTQRRRISIIKVLPATCKAKVLHVDHGVIEWVDTANIYPLPVGLQRALFQARPAMLAGIDCVARVDEVVEFLRGISNCKVKVNVIFESLEGKVCVELFDVEKKCSINQTLVELGFATPNRSNINPRDDFTPDLVKLSTPESSTSDAAVEEGKSERQRSDSVVSWQSNRPKSFMDGVTSEKSVVGLMDVETWVNDVGVGDDDVFSAGCGGDKSNNKQREGLMMKPGFNHFYQELTNSMNSGVSYPPPDLINSVNNASRKNSNYNTQTTNSTCRNNNNNNMIQIEGEFLTVDSWGPNTRTRMHSLWSEQKQKCAEMERRLNGLSAMSDAELRDHFNEMRRMKLNAVVNVKESRRCLEELQRDYDRVVRETNDLLTTV